MTRLVGGQAPRTLGGFTIPGLSTIVGDVEASARAQLYQRLADFQALPQRLNRIVAQLNAFAASTPTRGIDESARLAGLQTTVASAQANWSNANTTVSKAIASISGSVSLSAAADVAAAIAAMTLATSDVSTLEQDARDLISSSIALDDGQKDQLLALGAPSQFTFTQVAVFALVGYVAWRLMRNHS